LAAERPPSRGKQGAAPASPAIAVAHRTTASSASERCVGWNEQLRRLQPACYCGPRTGHTSDACIVTRQHHWDQSEEEGSYPWPTRKSSIAKSVERRSLPLVLLLRWSSGSSCWLPVTGSPGRSSLPRHSSVWPSRSPSFADSAAKSPRARRQGTSQPTDEGASGRHGRLGLQAGATGAATACPPLSHRCKGRSARGDGRLGSGCRRVGLISPGAADVCHEDGSKGGRWTTACVREVGRGRESAWVRSAPHRAALFDARRAAPTRARPRRARRATGRPRA
jgi:hypothetical protein